MKNINKKIIEKLVNYASTNTDDIKAGENRIFVKVPNYEREIDIGIHQIEKVPDIIELRNLNKLIPDIPSNSGDANIIDVVAAATGCSWDESYRKLFDIGFKLRLLLDDAVVSDSLLTTAGYSIIKYRNQFFDDIGVEKEEFALPYLRFGEFLNDPVSRKGDWVIMMHKSLLFISNGIIYINNPEIYYKKSKRVAKFFDKKMLLVYRKQ